MRKALFILAASGCGGSVEPQLPEPMPEPPIEPPPNQTQVERSVRVIYVRPSDKSYNQLYRDSLEAAMIDIREWYGGQLDGITFAMHDTIDECELPRQENYYTQGGGQNVVWDRILIPCIMLKHEEPANFIWVVVLDILDRYEVACITGGSWLGNGGGWRGQRIAMLNRGALIGITHPGIWKECEDGRIAEKNTSLGFIAHELVHAFGIGHRCRKGVACSEREVRSLPEAGNWYYPDTYLLQSHKDTLLNELNVPPLFRERR